jgi:hypothetical protein
MKQTFWIRYANSSGSVGPPLERFMPWKSVGVTGPVWRSVLTVRRMVGASVPNADGAHVRLTPWAG